MARTEQRKNSLVEQQEPESLLTIHWIGPFAVTGAARAMDLQGEGVLQLRMPVTRFFPDNGSIGTKHDCRVGEQTAMPLTVGFIEDRQEQAQQGFARYERCSSAFPGEDGSLGLFDQLRSQAGREPSNTFMFGAKQDESSRQPAIRYIRSGKRDEVL